MIRSDESRLEFIVKNEDPRVWSDGMGAIESTDGPIILLIESAAVTQPLVIQAAVSQC